MADQNRVILLGNVGSNPEIRHTQNGKKVARFRLATNRTWTQNGETKTTTEWHNIVVVDQWNVDYVESYVQKGTRLYLEGSIESRKYESGGETRYITEVVINPFRGFVSIEARAREKATEVSTTTASPTQGKKTAASLDDDIPF